MPFHKSKGIRKGTRAGIVFLCCLWSANGRLVATAQDSLPSPSGNQHAATGEGQEKQLLQTTLKQVEFIAKNTKTLEEFGKETFSQAQIFLDLKSSAVPILLQTLKKKEKNWKVRYWACDMLGYVGESVAEKELFLLVSDESQARLIRLRALDSILEIEKRDAGIGKKELKTKFRQMTKKVKDVKVKKKIQRILRKIKF